jgi:hypothetical protein
VSLFGRLALLALANVKWRLAYIQVRWHLEQRFRNKQRKRIAFAVMPHWLFAAFFCSRPVQVMFGASGIHLAP